MAISTVKAVINGVTHTLTLNSGTGKYEATVTAPSISSYNNNAGHYFPVSVTASDAAGNVATVTDADPTLGASLKLKVKEKVAPIITITAPTAGARIISNKPSITWTVSDEDSGVNPDTISVSINAGAAITAGITKTLNGKAYNCSYITATALPDGENTVKVNASDYDGNAASVKSVSFIVDTVAPTLSVASPTDSLVTNAAACTVSGTTNDTTSSPCTVTIKVNADAAVPATVEANGAFSKAITLKSGANTIVVTSTDAAGKSTSVTRTVTLDTVAPIISAVTLTPNPVDCGATYIISVSVTD